MAIQEDSIDVVYDVNSFNGTVTPGSTIVGKVSINVSQTIGFYKVNCKLQYELKGKLNIGIGEVKTIEISSRDVWEKGSKNDYGISFRVPDFPVSFSGRNLEIVWYLILEIVLDDPTKSEIRSQLLKEAKIFSLFKTYDGKIQEKKVVLVNNRELNYKVSPLVHRVAPSFQIFIIGGAFIGAVVFYFYSMDMIGIMSLVGGVLALGLIGYGIYRALSIGQLGKVEMNVGGSEDQKINMQLKIQKNHRKIKSIKAYYTIHEEVVDKRGTTSRTYREVVFTSESKGLKQPYRRTLETVLEYPKTDFPVTFRYKNARIFWQMNINFEFYSNTNYTLKKEFEIKRIEKEDN